MKKIINIQKGRDNPDGSFDLWVVDEDRVLWHQKNCVRNGAKMTVGETVKSYDEIMPFEMGK